MNVFKAPDLPEVYINNVIIRFHLGVSSININEIARFFGTNVLPIRVSNQNPYCARKKITIEVRRKSDEWYTIIPKPLQFMTDELKKKNLFDTMFHECLQEQRLEYMRECIEKGTNDYKKIEWREPWVPPCTAVIYKKGKCVISGIHTEEQGLYICWYLVKYLNIRLGIPATVKDFEVLNIVCDTRIGFPIDLDKLSKSRGSLAILTDAFPACIVHDEENPKLVSLVYPNGEMVETGARNTRDIVKRHKKMVELCRKFRLDPNESIVKTDRARERLKEQKKHTSGEHLLNVNNILKNLFKSLKGDVDDDEDDDTNENQVMTFLPILSSEDIQSNQHNKEEDFNDKKRKRVIRFSDE